MTITNRPSIRIEQTARTAAGPVATPKASARLCSGRLVPRRERFRGLVGDDDCAGEDRRQ